MTLSRRELLQLAALLPLGSAACRTLGIPGRAPAAVDLNDIHSRLNATEVADVVPVSSRADLRRLVARARRTGRSISIAGGRHSMGGQQFGAGTLHADTRPLDRLLDLDSERGVARVEAGIQWPRLIDHLIARQRGATRQWTIAQKQTGADRLSIGGALSANAHGRRLTLPPIGAEIEEIELIDADGELRRIGPRQEPELFSLVIGGYGLFGLVHTATLRLVRRRKVQRVVEVCDAERLTESFAERIRDGFLYGDFQFEIDPASRGFLQRGVLSCYRPVPDDTPVPAELRRLEAEDWAQLLYLAHTDKAEAFRRYSTYYLSTDGQIYWSDLHQLGYYDDGYHRALDRELGAGATATEMISEVYVPRPRLAAFLATLAESFRRSGTAVIYGTVRLIEPDEVSFLPWARRPFACIVVNLHVAHTEEGLARARDDFRRLIDLALEEGGSYFLTYHRWARRDQVLAAYPELPEFLRRKLAHDPQERFQSDWYRHYRTMFADLI